LANIQVQQKELALEKAYNPLTGLVIRSSDKRSRSLDAQVALLLWPAICAFLILLKLLSSLDWPWIIILAPVWLPLLAFVALLFFAMWLDKLSA
jgi:hypothetical protein